MSETEFLQRVSGALWSMSRYASIDDIDKAFDAVSSLIKHGGCPDEFFSEFRGAGSYKEAWQAGGLCIKFATGGTTIDLEMDVYRRAKEYDIQHIFCPTVFVKLPDNITIHLTEMDEELIWSDDPRYSSAKDNGHSARYAPPIGKYVVIQPLVGLLDNLTCPTTSEYYERPLKLQDGSQLTAAEYAVIDAPFEWRESIIEKYGDIAYRDMVWAMKRLNVEDLHSGNVGWLGDIPVIIDWMSYQSYVAVEETP